MVNINSLNLPDSLKSIVEGIDIDFDKATAKADFKSGKWINSKGDCIYGESFKGIILKSRPMDALTLRLICLATKGGDVPSGTIVTVYVKGNQSLHEECFKNICEFSFLENKDNTGTLYYTVDVSVD